MEASEFVLNARVFKALVEARTAYEAYLGILDEEGKTKFNVILKSYDESKKIAVIKEVRNVTGLGLKEAKDLVEEVPTVLMDGISKGRADNIKNAVAVAGGIVDIV